MKNKKSDPKSTNFKKSLYQWLAMGIIIGGLYVTGLHTHVIVAVQQAMLYTGVFNARGADIETSEGPYLTDADYAFSMVTGDGDHLDLGDMEGKVTFVNVWASWCPPCVAEMPTVETLYTSVAGNDDIRFVMLTVDQEPDNATRFMEDNKYTMPYQFPADPLPRAFNSSVLPTTYVVSKEGQVVYKKKGIANYGSASFRNWLIELSEK
ncbi:MAG: TlpA disulfide reductase family protein [Balneolales bacterium]